MATVAPVSSQIRPALLRVEGVRVSFGPVDVLAGVDLEVGAGEIVALAGEPGAGKTTLIRCMAGDVEPDEGELALDGHTIPPDIRGASRRGIAVVWQGLALCDNLDVAGNLLLGKETARQAASSVSLHARAAALLAEMKIPIRDTTSLVGSLSRSQRQLVAIASAVSRSPSLLVLDEASERLSASENASVEELLVRLRAKRTAILLVTQDLDQMFRVADRIVVLHRGRVVAELDPREAHRDDVAALMAGQEVDATARSQLSRLHGLADRLVSSDQSLSLSLITSALGTALPAEKILIHVLSGSSLECAASLGFGPGQTPWSRLPIGSAGGSVGRAAALAEVVVEEDLTSQASWAVEGDLVDHRSIASSWSVPVIGPGGVSAVITVFGDRPGSPARDELHLLALYAGYAASAVERDRLLRQVTARNRVLETVREMLEALSGAAPVDEVLPVALESLRSGLGAAEVALLRNPGDEGGSQACTYAGPGGNDPLKMSAAMSAATGAALSSAGEDGRVVVVGAGEKRQILAVPFAAPRGSSVLVALRAEVGLTEQERMLIEGAAHSLRLALERQESERASQQAAALRRSRELQRSFLSKLSHELRTPLTAIQGYASSLMAADVAWDAASEQRFLERIEAEAARVGRLVDDLLDFSAIESGVMRLHLDWCDLQLVSDSALACFPAEQRRAVSVRADPGLPSVWGDHDRLEQVFVNLLGNAFRHNPPETRVQVTMRAAAHASDAARNGDRGTVEITVTDNGSGLPPQLASSLFDPGRRERSHSAGAGLGLSIARGIVDAHGGTIELLRGDAGASFRIVLPVERRAAHAAGSDILQLIESQDSLVGSVGESRD
jgi:signal transduction histidine kinase/ABC-type multidrug transport system ATPase subunit